MRLPPPLNENYKKVEKRMANGVWMLYNPPCFDTANRVPRLEVLGGVTSRNVMECTDEKT